MYCYYGCNDVADVLMLLIIDVSDLLYHLQQDKASLYFTAHIAHFMWTPH